MGDRKYKQRGYMDSDERPSRAPSGPRQPPDGPRGRGLGAPTNQVFRCHDCGESLSLFESIAFDAACGKCSSALHSCTHCRFFDTSAINECTQPIRERIASKTKTNECDSFSPRITLENDSGSVSTDARSAFDALFE